MDYAQLAQTVYNIIDTHSDLTITYETKPTGNYTKTYDPASGAYKWYLNGTEVSEPALVKHTGKCLQTNISDYFRAKGYVQENDSLFLVSGIPKPYVGAKVVISGTSYTVVRVHEVKPASTSLLYKLVVRR